jgi:hypothetical protein
MVRREARGGRGLLVARHVCDWERGRGKWQQKRLCQRAIYSGEEQERGGSSARTMTKSLLGSVAVMMQSVGMQRRVPWLRRPGGLLEERVAYGTGSRGERQKGWSGRPIRHSECQQGECSRDGAAMLWRWAMGGVAMDRRAPDASALCGRGSVRKLEARRRAGRAGESSNNVFANRNPNPRPWLSRSKSHTH